MEDQSWIHILSFMATIFILLISFIGGYAVLRKRVKDLEDDSSEKLSESDHGKLCKITTLEMKNHVSDTMKDTIDGFKTDVFQPAMQQLLKAINGD